MALPLRKQRGTGNLPFEAAFNLYQRQLRVAKQMRFDTPVLGSARHDGHPKTLTKWPKPLSGVRVLIVEDETLQALALADMIAKLGGSVAAIANRIEDAMEASHTEEFDCAILDVNLGGTLSFPVAGYLQERGVPILFCTAYADAAEVFAGSGPVACLDKPIDKIGLRDALLGLLKQASHKVSIR
jgi:CheY-like chemotaxis protein